MESMNESENALSKLIFIETGSQQHSVENDLGMLNLNDFFGWPPMISAK